MKRLKLSETIRFSKCRGDTNSYQKCSQCHEHIGHGNIALCVAKACLRNDVNIWIHINCMDQFAKDIIKFKNENITKLLAEQITR